MIKHPLYLLMEASNPNHVSLELRTNLDPLQAYRFERSPHGEYVLHVPEPVITLATGTVDEMLLVAEKLFGIPHNADWHYLGERTHAYTVQPPAKLPEKKR